ncbi:MAG: FixH family protein [Gammaproteobacteria bacterium]
MSVIRNPVLLLAWGLPAVAVVASVLSLVLTLNHPDGQLPEQYHWEGFQLDRDFTQAAHAADLHVSALLSGFGPSGRCEVRLQMDGATPSALLLLLAHATKPKLDQRVTFDRVRVEKAAGREVVLYTGKCHQAVEGHWRLELIDAVNGWAIRQTTRGSLSRLVLDAGSGHNE